MHDDTPQPEPGQSISTAPDLLARTVLMRVGLRNASPLPLEQEAQGRLALPYSEWSMRLAVVQALGAEGQHAPLERLVAALHDEHQTVRAAAARTLGKQGSRTPVEPLVAALQDAAWQVRTEAALALGKQGNRTPVEPLVALLGDADDDVRAAAAWGLGELRERAPIEPLVMALQDVAWSVREAAALALRQLGERLPVAALAAALQDPDGSVRQAAGAALQTRFAVQRGRPPSAQPSLLAPASGWSAALAIISVLVLLPISLVLLLDVEEPDYSVLVGRLIALGITCGTILAINMVANRHREGDVP
jgi:hypothetical protein